MYAYKIVIFFMFFVSISHAGDNKKFFNETHLRWVGAVKLILNENYKYDQDIKEPKGTVQAVLEILFNDSLFKLHKDCLVYKIPENSKTGALRVISIGLNDKCSDFLFQKDLVSIDGIYNFGLSLDMRKLILKIDAGEIVYPLFNLSLPEELKLNQRPRANTEVQGAWISFFDSEKGEQLLEGDLCFDIDDNCNIIKTDFCDFCPNSVLSVKSNQCQHTYRKVCSRRGCGGKGEFACVRGNKASKYEGPYCIVDSPWAFCRKPNRVYCENKILVCR